MQDFEIEWVTVTTSKVGVSRTLTTVIGLAEFLLVECPDAKDAQQACLDALEGRLEPADARDAFIEGVTEAGLYVILSKPPSYATGKVRPYWKRKRKT